MRDISGDLRSGRSATTARPARDDTSFEDLMRIAAEQSDGLVTEPDRWRLLLDAVVTMAGDRTPEDLLGIIIESAADIVRARHAVLVVGSGHRQRPLAAHGLTDEEVGRLAGLPDAFDLLEPPGASYLAVPVGLGEKEPGTLFLTDKVDGSDFTAHDEQIVRALAAAAEVAIDNARLREDARCRERWLAAAADLTTALLRPEADDNALQIVADRTREVAGADVAWVVAGPDPAHQVLQAVSGLPVDPTVMEKLEFTRSLERCVAVSGRPLTVKRLSEHPRAVDVVGALGGQPGRSRAGRPAEQRDRGRGRGRTRLVERRRPRRRPEGPGDGDALRRAGRTRAPRRPRSPRPAAPGGAGGPGPHRPGPPRPGHPTAVRDRSGAAGHGRYRRPRGDGRAPGRHDRGDRRDHPRDPSHDLRAARQTRSRGPTRRRRRGGRAGGADDAVPPDAGVPRPGAAPGLRRPASRRPGGPDRGALQRGAARRLGDLRGGGRASGTVSRCG